MDQEAEEVIVLGKATNTRGDGRNVGNRRTRCRCDCGRIFVARTSWIERGKVTKCYSCLRADTNASEK